MRITIEIDEKSLKKIQQATGQKKKSPAVQLALSEFLDRQERDEFLARVLSGMTDYPLTNDELEAMDVYETR